MGSTECKSISNGKTTYFGTVSDGFTASEVHKGAAKLVSLLNMVGGLVGPSIGKVVAECKADYTADLVEQLLPRCDDKCQPMKQCKSRCEQLRSKCVPKSLQGYFPMIKKGGSLRSMIGMVGLTEGSSDLKVIDAWVNKLEKCESEDVTSSSHCLSPAYKGADCNPNDGGSSDGDDNNDNDNGNDNGDDNDNGNDDDNNHDDNNHDDNSGGSPSTECKSISNGKTTYFGTVSDGFTASEVHKGAAKLVSLLNMVGGLVGPSIGKVVAECKADYTADLVEQLLPRCDDKCQPMKQCK